MEEDKLYDQGRIRSRDHENDLYDTCTHVCHTTRHIVAMWAHTHVAVLFHVYRPSFFCFCSRNEVYTRNQE